MPQLNRHRPMAVLPQIALFISIALVTIRVEVVLCHARSRFPLRTPGANERANPFLLPIAGTMSRP